MTQKANQKDWRRENFIAKFQVAALELGVASYRDIESLKFRGISGFHEYQLLLQELARYKPTQIVGQYQGNAWKITDAQNNSLVIVEHETGLELLYIAGSIASIISLLPMVSNLWTRIKNRHGSMSLNEDRLEKRYFDINGRLIEEPVLAPEIVHNSLKFVTDQAEIVVSHRTFNYYAKSFFDLANYLIRHTKYFVYDPTSLSFCPAKFAGYIRMDFNWYAALQAGIAYRDVAFNGYSTRIAIEKALGRPFHPDKNMHNKLISWADNLVKVGVMHSVMESKWKFISLG
jgi:hypothetical protein